MEEKNGRIVEIVESTEVQKQQKNSKRNLRIMIASLILAGSVGYGAMNLSQSDSKEEQVAISTEYQNDTTQDKELTENEENLIGTLDELITLNSKNPTNQYYVLRNKESNAYQLCTDISQSNESWELLGKYGEFNLASELLNYQFSGKSEAKPIFREQVREIDNTTGEYGAWHDTDRVSEVEPEIPSETSRWVLQSYEPSVKEFNYGDLELYERVTNTITEDGKTITTGTGNFVICPDQLSSSVQSLLSNENLQHISNLQKRAGTIASLYAVVTTEDGKTTNTSYILTSDMSKVKLEDDQRLILIEKYDQEKEHPNCLFQKQTRTVSTDGENNLVSSGEWQTTDEYIIGYDAPLASLDTRYLLTGTLSTALENNPVIELPHVILDSKMENTHSISNAEYQISSDLNGIEISNISTAQDSIEETKSNPALYAVVTAKDGETADISYILTADDSNVKLEDDQQLVLVENYTEDELNSSFLYQKEQRQVSTDEQGTLTQAGEWQTTDDYIIRNDAPRNSVATRYVFKGTLSTVLENSPVVELPHVMLDNSKLNVTTQDTLTDEQKVALSQQAQNTIKSIYDDKFNSLQDYQESVQPNQPSFPSIQTTTSDERQQFLDKINQKITEMNQMLDNTNVNEQSNEGKTR